MLWKKFYAKVSAEFSSWLDKIGAKLTPPSISPLTGDVIKQLEKSINEVLTSTPELLELANSIFQNMIKRTTAIRNDQGQLAGIEIEGTQTVAGTLTGSTSGEGVPTTGPEEGTGIIESESGDINVDRVRRRMKSGIRIGFLDKPDDMNEGWIDPASQTITINTGHPAYKVASGLSVEGGVYHVWVFHLLRVVIRILSKETGDSPDIIENKILVEWYTHSIDETAKQQINKLFPTSSETMASS
jgi:hypothetical protein